MVDAQQWWEPIVTDHSWCERLRHDYPDKADWSDDALRQKYAQGQRYQVLWDHIGDAYEQFEPLADAYRALQRTDNSARR